MHHRNDPVNNSQLFISTKEIALTNAAQRDFTSRPDDIEPGFSRDCRDFNSWYHLEDMERLVWELHHDLLNQKVDNIQLINDIYMTVCFDGYGNFAELMRVYKEFLENSNKHYLFSVMKPELGAAHYVVCMLKKSVDGQITLFYFDPTGGHEDARFCKRLSLASAVKVAGMPLVRSRQRIQDPTKERGSLVSCGPLCIEFIKNFLNQERLNHLNDQLALPEELLAYGEGNESEYQSRISALRLSHYQRLGTIQDILLMDERHFNTEELTIPEFYSEIRAYVAENFCLIGSNDETKQRAETSSLAHECSDDNFGGEREDDEEIAEEDGSDEFVYEMMSTPKKRVEIISALPIPYNSHLDTFAQDEPSLNWSEDDFEESDNDEDFGKITHCSSSSLSSAQPEPTISESEVTTLVTSNAELHTTLENYNVDPANEFLLFQILALFGEPSEEELDATVLETHIQPEISSIDSEVTNEDGCKGKEKVGNDEQAKNNHPSIPILPTISKPSKLEQTLRQKLKDMYIEEEEIEKYQPELDKRGYSIIQSLAIILQLKWDDKIEKFYDSHDSLTKKGFTNLQIGKLVIRQGLPGVCAMDSWKKTNLKTLNLEDKLVLNLITQAGRTALPALKKLDATELNAFKSKNITEKDILSILHHEGGPLNLAALLDLMKPESKAHRIALGKYHITGKDIIRILRFKGGSYNLAALRDLMEPESEAKRIAFARHKITGKTIISTLSYAGGHHNLAAFIQFLDPLLQINFSAKDIASIARKQGSAKTLIWLATNSQALIECGIFNQAQLYNTANRASAQLYLEVLLDSKDHLLVATTKPEFNHLITDIIDAITRYLGKCNAQDRETFKKIVKSEEALAGWIRENCFSDSKLSRRVKRNLAQPKPLSVPQTKKRKLASLDNSKTANTISHTTIAESKRRQITFNNDGQQIADSTIKQNKTNLKEPMLHNPMDYAKINRNGNEGGDKDIPDSVDNSSNNADLDFNISFASALLPSTFSRDTTPEELQSALEVRSHTPIPQAYEAAPKYNGSDVVTINEEEEEELIGDISSSCNKTNVLSHLSQDPVCTFPARCEVEEEEEIEQALQPPSLVMLQDTATLSTVRKRKAPANDLYSDFAISLFKQFPQNYFSKTQNPTTNGELELQSIIETPLNARGHRSKFNFFKDSNAPDCNVRTQTPSTIFPTDVFEGAGRSKYRYLVFLEEYKYQKIRSILNVGTTIDLFENMFSITSFSLFSVHGINQYNLTAGQYRRLRIQDRSKYQQALDQLSMQNPCRAVC